MKRTIRLALMACVAYSLAACSSGNEAPTERPLVSIEIPAGGYNVERCQTLTLQPITQQGVSLSWWAGDSLVCDSDRLDFVALREGTYPMTLRVEQGGQLRQAYDFSINVRHESKAYSPYVAKVLDYHPAPGQFVNVYPEYAAGDTQADMNQKALQALADNNRGIVSLGDFGGYIVVGFDHTIVNTHGGYDFKVIGNAFEGSSEPGIVQVAFDRNKNGRPDADEWHEIQGSAHQNPATTRNYSITYFRPADSHVATPGNLFWQTDTTYLRFADNQGRSGFQVKNIYHAQSYFPAWIDSTSLTYSGTLLPSICHNVGTADAEYWVADALDWGYADNIPNDSVRSGMRIDWAVDAAGRKANLPGIDFVRVYTGVRQNCGWLGEQSTEVLGVTDLNVNQ